VSIFALRSLLPLRCVRCVTCVGGKLGFMCSVHDELTTRDVRNRLRSKLVTPADHRRQSEQFVEYVFADFEDLAADTC